MKYDKEPASGSLDINLEEYQICEIKQEENQMNDIKMEGYPPSGMKLEGNQLAETSRRHTFSSPSGGGGGGVASYSRPNNSPLHRVFHDERDLLRARIGSFNVNAQSTGVVGGINEREMELLSHQRGGGLRLAAAVKNEAYSREQGFSTMYPTVSHVKHLTISQEPVTYPIPNLTQNWNKKLERLSLMDHPQSSTAMSGGANYPPPLIEYHKFHRGSGSPLLKVPKTEMLLKNEFEESISRGIPQAAQPFVGRFDVKQDPASCGFRFGEMDNKYSHSPSTVGGRGGEQYDSRSMRGSPVNSMNMDYVDYTRGPVPPHRNSPPSYNSESRPQHLRVDNESLDDIVHSIAGAEDIQAIMGVGGRVNSCLSDDQPGQAQDPPGNFLGNFPDLNSSQQNNFSAGGLFENWGENDASSSCGSEVEALRGVSGRKMSVGQIVDVRNMYSGERPRRQTMPSCMRHVRTAAAVRNFVGSPPGNAYGSMEMGTGGFWSGRQDSISPGSMSSGGSSCGGQMSCEGWFRESSSPYESLVELTSKWRHLVTAASGKLTTDGNWAHEMETEEGSSKGVVLTDEVLESQLQLSEVYWVYGGQERGREGGGGGEGGDQGVSEEENTDVIFAKNHRNFIRQTLSCYKRFVQKSTTINHRLAIELKVTKYTHCVLCSQSQCM